MKYMSSWERGEMHWYHIIVPKSYSNVPEEELENENLLKIQFLESAVKKMTDKLLTTCTYSG